MVMKERLFPALLLLEILMTLERVVAGVAVAVLVVVVLRIVILRG